MGRICPPVSALTLEKIELVCSFSAYSHPIEATIRLVRGVRVREGVKTGGQKAEVWDSISNSFYESDMVLKVALRSSKGYLVHFWGHVMG